MNINNLKKGSLLTATHPGELLHDEIEYRGISIEELAAWMSTDITLLRVIMEGERSMTADIALLLERTLGIDAYFWMRTQAKYDVDSLRIKEWESNGDLMNDTLSGSAAILKEPKSSYANLGKKFKTQ